ncbi:MAG TPA: SGNH/GDSL hydrolase family protein [Solirubrobacteraceae bacterium]|nr:SGNH/GDSL hydrolase family protein [Solirubrobacteraceae bacterium]
MTIWRTRAGIALAAVVLLVSVGAGTASAKTKATPHYYLALGDSLSVGFQPNPQGVGKETSQGYTNDLFAYEKKTVPDLKLVEMGCPGDTTTSLLTGEGNSANAKTFKCDRSGGSQLNAAEKFLKTHHTKGEVVLVTLDIGANDVDGCADVPSSQLGACVTAGENSIKSNTPKILAGIRGAAAKGTALAAMNLYDPVLGDYFDPSKQPLANASVSLLKGINADIQSADAAGKFKTADVADAFDTYDTATEVTYRGQQVPKDVAVVCTLTWACTAPPQGPNVHAKKTGYAVIAKAFEAVVGKLH